MGDGARSLVKKLAAVMAAVDRVPKSGHNNFHNYDYATEADIVAGVREQMAKQNLMIVPNVKKCDRRAAGAAEKPKTITLLEVEFTICDGDSGEEKSFTVFGEGSDNEDKGTYKAFTGAEKYALLKLFLIPTGDDPEADGKPEPRQRAGSRAEAPQRSQSTGAGPTVFPNFGKAKGQPIFGASLGDLDYYRQAAEKSLADASKAKWHDKERALLAAYDAEAERQKTASGPAPEKPSVPFAELWAWAESQKVSWEKVKAAIKRVIPAGTTVSRSSLTEGQAAKARGILEEELSGIAPHNDLAEDQHA